MDDAVAVADWCGSERKEQSNDFRNPSKPGVDRILYS